MQQPQIILLIISSVFMLVFIIAAVTANRYSLNRIKSRKVGDGQFGTARFATKREIWETYKYVPFLPMRWRDGNYTKRVGITRKLFCKLLGAVLKRKIIPKQKTIQLPQGTIVGQSRRGKNSYAIVDTGDVHTLMIGAAGVGKTACFIYPNIEYACASGMSFIETDTKGDIARNYGGIAKQYGFDVSVIDLRNPTKSDAFNMLSLVNKYMDIHLNNPENLSAKARAEKYAKITAKTIIYSGGADATAYGQNAYFYDAAEGLLTAIILLVAEYCEPQKRHIISVFKLVQDLLAPSSVKGKSQFQLLIDRLPDTHKARWFAGSALNTGEQAMASVMSTAMSRLNTFLDSELEQILCFDTCIDAEKFCNTKSAIFLIMPEEDNTKYFLISLIVQQLYREILSIADEKGGKLDNRVMFYLDEIGTIPKIDSAEMMYSSSRSRKISIVSIVQSLAQFEKNYGKEGAAIIVDNCQVTLFGGFAPNSSTAEVMSKNLGDQTVMSGSVTRNDKNGSQQLQMIARPLMTPDELKAMPKFHFIVAKTGCHPMKTKLELFFKWGIQFGQEYKIADKAAQKVEYANKADILDKLGAPKEEPPVEKEAVSSASLDKQRMKQKRKEAQEKCQMKTQNL